MSLNIDFDIQFSEKRLANRLEETTSKRTSNSICSTVTSLYNFRLYNLWRYYIVATVTYLNYSPISHRFKVKMRAYVLNANIMKTADGKTVKTQKRNNYKQKNIDLFFSIMMRSTVWIKKSDISSKCKSSFFSPFALEEWRFTI